MVTSATHIERLMLQENELTYLPEFITKLSNLTKLVLDRNKFTEIPAVVTNITTLKLLDMNSLELTEVPDSIGSLTALVELGFEQNKLVKLSEELSKLTQLRTFSIIYNTVPEFPNGLTALTNLELLCLHSNRFTEFPGPIHALTNLTKLTISDNFFKKELPSEISKLTKLIELHLDNTGLLSIPYEMTEMTQLTTLYINANPLTNLPNEFSHLRNLEDLDISDLTLNSDTLSTIFELQNLTSLLASNIFGYDNEFNKAERRIPANISQLSKLGKFTFGKNKIKEVPAELFTLTNLHLLHLVENAITELPAGISRLTKYVSYKTFPYLGITLNVSFCRLSHLNLHRNELDKLPAEASHLQHLTSLDVDSNRLTNLPNLANLMELQVLVLGHNKLTEIPDWFYGLTRLTRVNFRDNKIARVSPKIARLVNLTNFHIESNLLRSFPKEATQLYSLYLHHNYIEQLSEQFSRCNYISLRSSNTVCKYPPLSIEHYSQPPEFLVVQKDLYDEEES